MECVCSIKTSVLTSTQQKGEKVQHIREHVESKGLFVSIKRLGKNNEHSKMINYT